MLPYIAEFIGTAMLLLLGCGVVANVSLEKSGMKSGSGVMITMGWGLAVMLPCFIFGAASGAHINPALTIGFAVAGKIAWEMVPGYIIAQFAGAIVGSFLVWLLFKKQLDMEPDKYKKFRVFATDAAVKCLPLNILAETVATFVLVFSILGTNQVPGLATGVSSLLVYGVLVSIGMSLGGLTGYAINPARDLGPRLIHAIMPIKNKQKDSKWSYGFIVPVIGPILGAVLAAGLYMIIPW